MQRLIIVMLAVASCGYPALPAIGGDAGPSGSDGGGSVDSGGVTDSGPNGSDGGSTVTPPSDLAYSANPIIYTAGFAITPNTPTSSGGAVASYAVSPALPSGLSLDTSTGVIGGTPTAQVAFASYTITATNTGGSTTANVSIAVELTGLVATGEYHTCALASGSAWCWGNNNEGQLGDNSSNPSEVPVMVSGLTSGVQAIATGYMHTCAIASGAAWCWGYGIDGELGNNELMVTHVPVQVIGLTSGVQAVAAGGDYTCALVNGGVQCWGGNSDGQLGNDSTTSSSEPVDVVGLSSGVRAIAAGDHHSCALVNGGGVVCWGYNVGGELGNDSTTNSSVPVQVVGLTSGALAIAAGGLHSCALMNDGGVQCWGVDVDGQLGNNSTASSPVPVHVSALSGVQAISAGGAHTCALGNGGGVQCWGDDTDGQLGNDSTTSSSVPVQVTDLTGGGQALATGAGAAHSCALVSGHIDCWGANAQGQLGNNSTTSTDVPVPVTGF